MAGVSPTISEQVSARLAPYIGDLNARVWVQAVARRALGVAPEKVTAEKLAVLVDGLRPSLRTLMGRGAADDLLARIGREVS